MDAAVSNEKGGIEDLRTYGSIAEVTIDDDSSPLITVAETVALDDHHKSSAPAPVFRDVPFAILFVLHLVFMLYLGIGVAPEGYRRMDLNWTSIEVEIRANDNDDDDNSMSDEDWEKFHLFLDQARSFLMVYPQRILSVLILPCLLLSFLVAFGMAALVIKRNTKRFVIASLTGAFCCIVIMVTVLVISSQSFVLFVLGLLATAGVGYYVLKARKLVPFAAVNLKAALDGVSKNWGLYMVAFCFAELGFAWNVFWVYTFVGVGARHNEVCFANNPDLEGRHPSFDGDDDDPCDLPLYMVLGFLLSLYWTSTVIMNTVQTIVAGVMATWCFVSEEADHCCSPAVCGSVFRSLTYSFGSVCFGSLCQAIVSALRWGVESARRRSDAGQGDSCGNVLLCVLECIARLMEDLLDYFSQWAYVFCAVYGLSYLESGRSVFELFRTRGWTAIVSDKLVAYTLHFSVVLVGVVTGLIGVVINAMAKDGYMFGELPGSWCWAFFLSFVVGIWIASVMMNVVKGAVLTLIVCWADSPAKLEKEHPALTAEMIDAWSTAFVDLRLRPMFPPVRPVV